MSSIVLSRTSAPAAAMVLALVAAGRAAAELVGHELRVAGAVQRVFAEDVDGDGRRELIVFSVAGKGELERRVSVFVVDNGVVAATPRTSWALDADAGMFDIGHDPVEGPSLWYCTATAVRRYRLRGATAQAPDAETWLEAPSLLGGRSHDWVLFHDFVRDWRGDGRETPAIFQPGHVLLPRGNGAAPPEVIELRTEIDVPEVPTVHDLAPGMPLLITHRVPSLTRVDTDGDQRADLVATLGDRIEVHAGVADGSFSRRADRATRLPSPAGPNDETRRQVIQLADVTGDGKVDAILTTITGGIGNLTQSIDIFPGTGRDFAPTPSATVTTQGAVSLTVLGDVDGDRRPEITTVSIEIGVRALLSFLLTRHMPVEFATYSIDRTGRLGARPLLEWSRPLRLELTGPTDPGIVTLAGDFDADGVRDLVSAPGDDEVEIRRIVRERDGLAMGDVIARLEAPGRGQALATDLDGDKRSDLVLYAPRGPAGRVSVFLSGSGAQHQSPTP